MRQFVRHGRRSRRYRYREMRRLRRGIQRRRNFCLRVTNAAAADIGALVAQRIRRRREYKKGFGYPVVRFADRGWDLHISYSEKAHVSGYHPEAEVVKLNNLCGKGGAERDNGTTTGFSMERRNTSTMGK